MSDETTHYDVLGVSPSASKADIKAAYQTELDAARASGDGDRVSDVRRAWQVLSDPVQRQRYDDQIELPRRSRDDALAATTPLDEHEHLAEDDVEVVDEQLFPPPPPPPGAPLPVGAPAFLEQPTIGRRMVASLIDLITIVAVFAASYAITFSITSNDTARGVAIVGLFEIWVLALFLVPTWRNGQTLGKRFTFIMTVSRATGELLTPMQVLARYAVPMLAVPAIPSLGPFLALFYGLSYAMARDQISLADRIARSIVVVARYEPTHPGHAG